MSNGTGKRDYIHARSGLYFQRRADGSVTLELPSNELTARYYPVPNNGMGYAEVTVTQQYRFTAAEWDAAVRALAVDEQDGLR